MNKTGRNADCVQVREPRLCPASDVDNANETGTRIAKDPSSNASGQHSRKSARGRVFPAVRSESVLNVTLSDDVGHGRT